MSTAHVAGLLSKKAVPPPTWPIQGGGSVETLVKGNLPFKSVFATLV